MQPWATIYAIRNTRYAIRNTQYEHLPFTSVENPLQIDLFMQNKPNSLNVQIYINIYDTKTYKNKTASGSRKKQTQSNPISKMPKMNANSILTKDYERNDIFAVSENKAKTNPNKACPERIEFTLSVIEGNGPISPTPK